MSSIESRDNSSLISEQFRQFVARLPRQAMNSQSYTCRADAHIDDWDTVTLFSLWIHLYEQQQARSAKSAVRTNGSSSHRLNQQGAPRLTVFPLKRPIATAAPVRRSRTAV